MLDCSTPLPRPQPRADALPATLLLQLPASDAALDVAPLRGLLREGSALAGIALDPMLRAASAAQLLAPGCAAGLLGVLGAAA